MSPLIEGGHFPIKRAVGEDIVVEADVFKDGHDVVSAVLKWRKRGEAKWYETAMECIDPYNRDRWRGVFSVFENAVYEYTIEAWGDFFRSWQHEFQVKFEAGQTELASETLEGAGLIARAAKQAQDQDQKRDAERLVVLADKIREWARRKTSTPWRIPPESGSVADGLCRSQRKHGIPAQSAAGGEAYRASRAGQNGGDLPVDRQTQDQLSGNVIAFPAGVFPLGKEGDSPKKKKAETISEPSRYRPRHR